MNIIENFEHHLLLLRKQIDKIDPSSFGQLPKGNLVFKYTQCHKTGCGCMTGEFQHGPYAYLQWSDEKGVHQQYLNRRLAKKMLVALAERERYMRLKEEERFYSELIGVMKRIGLGEDEKRDGGDSIPFL